MVTYETALFDLDGTLVHTEREYYLTIMNNIIKELKLPQVTDEIIDGFWNSMDKFSFAQENFHVPLETIWSTLRKYEDLDFRKKLTKAYNDVNYLERLKSLGFKLGLVTGASERICKLELSMLPVTFDTIILARPTYGVKLKPDPEGILMALRNLNGNLESAFYVGNATEDVLAAKSAGVLDISIERGTNKIEAVPTRWINSLYDLEFIIS